MNILDDENLSPRETKLIRQAMLHMAESNANVAEKFADMIDQGSLPVERTAQESLRFLAGAIRATNRKVFKDICDTQENQQIRDALGNIINHHFNEGE
jgi:hypothetical protein